MRRWFVLILLFASCLGFSQSAREVLFFHNHCLFIHNGYLKNESATPAQIMRHYEVTGKDEPIVIHFHGGLVSESSAKKEALDLNNTCYGGRSYPIFLAWNADLFTELGNLLEAKYHNLAFAQGRISTAAFLSASTTARAKTDTASRTCKAAERS